MITNPNSELTGFLQTVSVALGQLKQRLQRDYEQAYSDYPDLHHLIRIVLDVEEARARELTSFPHLLFSDMVEAHLASLNVRPVGTRYHAREQREVQTYDSAFAVCG